MATPDYTSGEPLSSSSAIIDSNSTPSSDDRTSTVESEAGSGDEEIVPTVEAVRENSRRRKDYEDEVWRPVKIPRRLAFEWYSDSLSSPLNFNYAVLLNKYIKGLNLNEEDITVHNRFKKKMHKLFGSKFKGLKGASRKRYLDEPFFYDVKNSERVSSLSTQVASLQDTVKRLENEVATKGAEVEHLKESLGNCKELLKKSATTINEGKLYNEVEERQKRRKVFCSINYMV